MNRKMVLRNKLNSLKMSRYDNVTNYFMRITQVRDQLAIIVENMEDVKLVNVALNDIPKFWEPFFKGVCVGNIFHIDRDFGMIAFRKRCERSLKQERKEIKMRRTWTFSIRQERKKERVLRVPVRSQPHSQVKRI
jgi:hypothetical protein